MVNYQKYDSIEAAMLYMEFLSIPDNRLEFEIPEGFSLSARMAHTMLNAAYHVQGKNILPS